MDHWESKRIPEKHQLLLYIDYAKDFDCVDHNKLWTVLKEIQTTLPSWETCIWVKKQQLESDMEQETGSKLGKE